MNFMNRKLFKGRAARDKLNKMGGIMASSQPLMQTVQKFNVGGGVQSTAGAQIPTSGMGLKGFVPDMSRQDFLRLPPEQQRKFIQAAQNRRYINRVGSKAGILAGGYSDAVLNPLIGLANLGVEGAKRLGLTDPTSDFSIPYTDSVGKSVERLDKNEYIPGKDLEEQAQAYAGLLATERGEFQDPQIANAMDRYKREQDKAAETLIGMSTAPPARGDADPEVEPEFQSEFTDTRRLTDGAARDQFAAGPAAQDPALAAAKKGEKGPAAQAAAIFNEGTEPEVEMTLEQLMTEFTSAAPEREGMDKGLAIAKIGFAMAAGQSPDAITNIASALSQGADMFIKDKKEKDAFDRQIKLSALQYGLTDIGKQRAEQRLIDREGRALKTYYNEKGESKTISVAELRKNGVPKGFGEPELIKAALERQKAGTDAIDEMIKNGTITTKDGRAESDAYKNSTKNIIGAETAIGLLENAYVDVVDGKVTGGAAALKGLLEKGGNVFGIELGQEYKSIEQARDAFRFGLQKVIPVSVGATQSANSISDRDVDLLITAMFGPGAIEGGTFSLITQDADLMAERIGRAINEIRQGQRDELANLQSIESRLGGMYMPGSSRQMGVTSALTQIAPFRERLQGAGFTSQGRPTTTTVGLTQVGVENGIPVFDFSK